MAMMVGAASLFADGEIYLPFGTTTTPLATTAGTSPGLWIDFRGCSAGSIYLNESTAASATVKVEVSSDPNGGLVAGSPQVLPIDASGGGFIVTDVAPRSLSTAMTSFYRLNPTANTGTLTGVFVCDRRK